MKKSLQTPFDTRQYMLSSDFELYYYNDCGLTSVAGHTHDYYEFYFFLEGNVSMEIRQIPHALSYGDMIVIPPDTSHRLLIHDATVPYRRFVLWISRAFFDRLLHTSPDYGYFIQLVQQENKYVFHHDRIVFHSIQSKLLRILQELLGQQFCREAQLVVCVSDLLLHLNRLVYEQKHFCPPSAQDSLFQNLCSFIDAHMEENLSLERLSSEFFVSKFHISHVFKENLGISIHQYITKKRLNLCCQSILGGMPITEACQTFAFSDYSSFFRAFKQEYGMSPREFRDLNRPPL